MAAPYRLKVKIGNAEFEAEGTEETVRAQFAEFQKLIEVGTPLRASAPGASRPAGPDSGDQQVDLPPGYDRLFTIDDRNGRKTVRLQYLPTGKGREATAIRLLLLGYRAALQTDRVRVTALLDALRGSGLPIARLDNYSAESLRDGLLLKGGAGKGGTYGLSVTGVKRAEEELAEMLAKA